MSHLQEVKAWAQTFAPQAQVLFADKKLGKFWQSVDGRFHCLVEEIYLVQQVLPRNKESFEKMQALQNALTLAGRGQIAGEKTQLAKVLAGNACVYQITLKAGYQMDLEDEYGKD